MPQANQQSTSAEGGSAAETGKEKAAEVAGQAQEKAQQAAGQVQDRVREQIDQRSSQAAEQIKEQGSDLRSVSESLRKGSRLNYRSNGRCGRVGCRSGGLWLMSVGLRSGGIR